MAETIAQYLNKIQAARDRVMQDKVSQFMPLVDNLIRKNAYKEEQQKKRMTAENDVRAQALALGYKPEDVDGFIAQNASVSPEALPAMFNQYDKQRIISSDLIRWGVDVPANASYADLSNLHAYYNKAASQGEMTLSQFKERVRSGASPESALADIEFTNKYRTKIRESFGEKYSIAYDEAIKAGKSPDLAFNEAATRFEADHPKPKGGTGGGTGKQDYKGLVTAKVGKEKGDDDKQQLYVYWINNIGQKVKSRVYTNAQGKIAWVDTKELVDLNALEDYATIDETEYTAVTKQPYAKNKAKTTPTPKPGTKANSGTGWVWE